MGLIPNNVVKLNTYDLISGNVNEMAYQSREVDQWTHRYEYDADNRITAVETSKDGVLFDKDAKYFYYAHGPLARTEIGDLKVQGCDYAYTLQGWIKGVNSESLLASRDMGQDGNTTGVNKLFARDVFGYSLGYYTNDYKAIDPNKNLPANNFLADKNGSDLLNNQFDLFNGNIGSMVTTITDLTGLALPNGMAYKYDQLNRLIHARGFDNLDVVNNTWGSTGVYNGRYENKFSYDANGNIETALAKNQAGQTIDDQIYRYQTVNGKKINNRMYAINDVATITSGNDLPSGQIAFDNTAATTNTINNYSYDETGEMKADKQDEIAEIKWRVDGKIKEVTRTAGSSRKNLKFDYDAMGKRIAKNVYDNNNSFLYSEYYVRDAQGNIMAVYRYENNPQNQTQSYKVTERFIYGNQTLGIDKTQVELIGAPLVNTTSFTRILGNKHYTGGNHLGNVLSTFTDKKFAISLDNILVDHYIPDVIAANDYQPFGGLMTERTFNKNTFPNSFNGKRDDPELDDWQDYGMRPYSPWERRPPTVDPIAKGFPELSTYQFFSNSPIANIDLDGLEKVTYLYKTNQETGKPQLTNFRVEKFDEQGNLLPFSRHAELNGKPTTFTAIYPPAPAKNIFEKAGDVLVEGLKKADAFNNAIKGKSFGEGEGISDPANLGTITQKDVMVGLGVVGVITGAGALIEAGSVTAAGVAALINSSDDALGALTNGEGSALQDLSTGQLKQIITAGKSISAFFSSAKGVKELTGKGKEAFNKAFTTIDAVVNVASAALSTKELAKPKEGAVK